MGSFYGGSGGGGSGGGASITIDRVLNKNSYNAVANAPVAKALDDVIYVNKDKDETEFEVPTYEEFTQVKDEMVKQVKTVGTALTKDENGAVNIPLAGPETYGLLKVKNSDYNWTGIREYNGLLMLTQPSNQQITNRSETSMAVTLNKIDHAVRAGLVSNSQITDADYPEIHKTLGINREWVLKGAIIGDENDRGNIDAGTNVNMEGCTEIIIEGWIAATAGVMLSMSPPHSGIVSGIGINGIRYSKTYIIETGNGMSTVYAKASDSKAPMYVSSALTTYDYVQYRPKDIVKFLFEPSYRTYVTSCDLKIYAR